MCWVKTSTFKVSVFSLNIGEGGGRGGGRYMDINIHANSHLAVYAVPFHSRLFVLNLQLITKAHACYDLLLAAASFIRAVHALVEAATNI